MPPRDDERLADILVASSFLAAWLADATEESFRERLLLSAVVRELTIIGEAAMHLSPEFKARPPDVPWRDIADMRNILVHAYNRVDTRVVWLSATRDVPELAAMRRAALDSSL